MRWFKHNLRSSIYGLLGSPVAPTESMLETSMEDIREAMLALLNEPGPPRSPTVTRRIRYATDIQALWYLRGDLMAVLATTRGEMAARDELQAITQMFQGLLPSGLHSRASRLES